MLVAEKSYPIEVQEGRQHRLLDMLEDERLEEVVHWIVLVLHCLLGRCATIGDVL